MMKLPPTELFVDKDDEAAIALWEKSCNLIIESRSSQPLLAALTVHELTMVVGWDYTLVEEGEEWKTALFKEALNRINSKYNAKKEIFRFVGSMLKITLSERSYLREKLGKAEIFGKLVNVSYETTDSKIKDETTGLYRDDLTFSTLNLAYGTDPEILPITFCDIGWVEAYQV
jgi:hypothetical protein